MRFHSKVHSNSHFSDPVAGYPDSASDPIASQSDPFQGDFYLNGVLYANTISLSSSVNNLEVDTLIVNNEIATLDVGVLEVTSFATNTDGTNLINVNATTLDSLNSTDFEQVVNKDISYVGLDNGVVNSIDNIVGLSSLNGLTVSQYLNEFDLSSSVAPLVSGQLPDDFIPDDITGLSSINGVDISDYLVDGDDISLLTNDSGYLTSFTETDPIFSSWETNTDYLEWTTPAPTLSSDTGTAGDVAYDSDYLYICVATDEWKRVALNGW